MCFCNCLPLTNQVKVVAGSKVLVTFHRSRVEVTAPSINYMYQATQIPLDLIEYFVRRLGLGDTCCLLISNMVNLTFTCGKVTCTFGLLQSRKVIKRPWKLCRQNNPLTDQPWPASNNFYVNHTVLCCRAAVLSCCHLYKVLVNTLPWRFSIFHQYCFCDTFTDSIANNCCAKLDKVCSF